MAALRTSLLLALAIVLCLVAPASAGAVFTVQLDPGFGSQDVGTSHSETVTLLNDGIAAPDQTVHYTIAGANPASVQTVVTDSAGQATIQWNGVNAGSDSLRAWFDTTANGAYDSGEPTDTASVNFNRGSLFISTSSSDNIGALHSATITVEDGAGNPREGASVQYSISGANPSSEQTVATDSNGEVVVQWTGTNAGFDTISAWYDFDGDEAQDLTDPSDEAEVNFSLGTLSLSGPSTGSTGTQYSATVNLYDGAFDPRAGAPVRYTIAGANPGSGQVTTDGSGEATIQWTGNAGGIDTLTAYYDANANATMDENEPQDILVVNWIASILSGGPVTHIHLGGNMACQARYAGDTSDEFYGGIPGSCGTHVAVDGTVWGPQTSDYTPVSQSAVTGSGTAASPFRVVTVACAGTSEDCGSSPTAPLVTQTVTYVTGQDYYRTDVTVSERSGASKPAVIYQYADCYLGNSDSGYGFYDASSGGIYCSKNPDNSPAGRIEGFVPLSSGSSYHEAGYSTVRSAMSSGQPFQNICECGTLQDNGMGLSYAVTVPAGGQVTRAFLTAFSPTGNAVDVAAPAVSVTAPGEGSSTTDHTPELAGDAGSQEGDSPTVTVRVYSGPAAAGSPVQTLAATRAGAAWRVDAANLPSGAYTVQAEQADDAGNTGTSNTRTFTVVDPPVPPPPPPGLPKDDIDGFLVPPPPTVFKSVNVAPAKGTVLVKLPGTGKFVNLSDAERVPVGTVIDTRRGTVRMTSAADTKGRVQTGDFYQGMFTVKQQKARIPVTQMQLSGTSFRRCPKSARRSAGTSATRPRNRLWGKAKGRFSTRGRYAAATVRGTEWFTEDRCDGTFVKVRKGVVQVQDFKKRKRINLKARRSYLARP